ncbi:MAG: glycine oxidase ThiO [Chloroflexi bacterium]|nr:glycine oxidase ThiO [Chloroflexota bacterium]
MSDVVIVGGGIVGLACAYETARAGMKVTLLEYGKTAMQATNAAAGMLAPMIESHGPGPMLDLGLRALHDMPEQVDELQQRCGFDLELRLHGILKVAFTEEQFAELRQRQAWLESCGHDVALLDGEQCREAAPRISERVIGGIYSASEGSVSNQMLALALERGAEALGVDIRQRAPAVGFTTGGERVTAVRTPDGDVGCDAVVIAAGARSGQIAARLSVNGSNPIPVRPIRGQMIALGGMSCPIRSVVWGPEGYLVPRANGLVFAGATVEDVGFRRRTTTAGLRAMRSMASRLVPQLRASQQRFDWAGLRPGTPDGLPIIGPMPAWLNVIAATGHFRNGILLGPITGRLVANGLGGDWSETSPEFSPGRFV